ncbi:MUC13 protein, partial [Atractosteus spatula]|nr:MUC13 protein [Atractosteus spatula]
MDWKMWFILASTCVCLEHSKNGTSPSATTIPGSTSSTTTTTGSTTSSSPTATGSTTSSTTTTTAGSFTSSTPTATADPQTSSIPATSSSMSSTPAITASPTVTATPKPEKKQCRENSCGSQLAVCMNLKDKYVCQCSFGFYYNELETDCEGGKSFPGGFNISPTFGVNVEDKTSENYTQLYDYVIQINKEALINELDFKETIVKDIRHTGGSTYISRSGRELEVDFINMFSTTFEDGLDVVDTKILNYLKEANLTNIRFRNVTSCGVYGCDKQSSNCALKGSSPVCECKKGYEKNHPLDVSCVKLEDTMRDILIGVSTVAGVAIISLTAGLIVMAMRKKPKNENPPQYSFKNPASFPMTRTFSVKSHRDSEDGSQMTQRPPSFPKMVYNRHHDDEENDDDDDGSYAGKIKNQSFPQDQGRILSGNVYSFPKASVPSKPGGPQNFGYKPAGNPYNSSANDRYPYNSSANDRNPYNSSANDRNPYNSSANDRYPYNSSANDRDPYNRTSTRGAAGNGYGHRGY